MAELTPEEVLAEQRRVGLTPDQIAKFKISPPNLPNLTAQPTAPAYAPVSLPKAEAPAAPAAPQPYVDPHVAQAQADLDAAKKKPAGIAHYIPITQGDGFGHKLLRGLEHVGRGVANVAETGLDIAAPGIMANIPGTYMGRAAEVGRDQAKLGQAQDVAEKNQQIAKYNQDVIDAQHKPVTLQKGHNAQTDNDEYFRMDGDKPVFTGVEVPSSEKAPKAADTPLTAADAESHNKRMDAIFAGQPGMAQQYYVRPGMPNSIAEKRATDARADYGVINKPDKAPKTEIKESGGRLISYTYDDKGKVISHQDIGPAGKDGSEQHVDSPFNGEQYLATLPSGVSNKIRDIAGGHIKVSPAYFRSKEGSLLLEQITQAYPNFDASRADAYFGARDKFTHGKAADAIAGTNGTILHAKELHDLAGAWSQIPGLSTLSRLTGGDAAKLNTTRTLFEQELGHAYKGGVITDQELQQFKKMVDVWSPAELRTNMETVVKRLNEITESRYQEWLNSKPPADSAGIQFYSKRAAQAVKDMTGLEPTADMIGEGAPQARTDGARTVAPQAGGHFNWDAHPKAN